MRQGIHAVALESHEDVDPVARDAVSGVVGETEAVVHLSRGQRDAHQRRQVQHGAKFDPARIDGGRPIRDELVAWLADAERRIEDDEIPKSTVLAVFDVDNASVAEPGRALYVERAPESRSDVRDDTSVPA